MADVGFLKDYTAEINSWLDSYLATKSEPKVVYGLIKEFLALGGKRFRPALSMITAEMLGAKRSSSLPPACSIEMFHNFTLIHDDIEDDSELRRGKPCLHNSYGIPLAINAGDGLFILVWDVLCNLPYSLEVNSKIQKTLASTYRHVLDGQGIELSWIRNNKWDISEQDYYSMAYGKTASLIEGAMVVGGLVAGADAKTLSSLAEFGRNIGTGFQIQDDYLNIVGEEEKYKKEIGGDISEGKRTLMTIYAMKSLSTSKAERLKDILSMHTKNQDLISEAIGLLKESGSTEYAHSKAMECISKAVAISESKFPHNMHRNKLIEIAKYLVYRDY